MNLLRILCVLSLSSICITAGAAEHFVDVQDAFFSPKTITVSEGDTVTWENKGASGHTTTSGSSCAPDGTWTADLFPTQKFSQAFPKAGTYPYYCKPHCSGGMTGTVIVKAASAEDQRIRQGFAIAPVPLNTKNLKPAQKNAVGLGSYIVNAQGACADCHSCPTYAVGGNPFKGEPKKFQKKTYLAGNVQFGPDLLSRNITPDASGKPAGLTLAQFQRTFRTGKDFKHAHPQLSPLLQAMPWPIYGQMTDSDIAAIYQYLKAIPRANPPVNSCTAPGQ